MVNEATRKLVRSFKKISFITTKYPEDYENVNEEYKRLRNELNYLYDIVKSLQTYESGGTIMKNFTSMAKKINKSKNLKFLNFDDIYTRAALVGEELANTTHNSSIKTIGTSFSDAFLRVAENKSKFNGELSNILGTLKVLKDHAKMTDTMRTKAYELRYDLEEMIQNNGNKDDISNLETSFNGKSEEALKGMKAFMGESGVSGILKKIAAAYRNFNLEAAKSLEIVK